MTEEQWLTSADPQARLTFLRDSGKLSERKARLFAVACCRHGGVWGLLPRAAYHRIVEVNERLADGLATVAEVSMALISTLEHFQDVQDSIDQSLYLHGTRCEAMTAVTLLLQAADVASAVVRHCREAGMAADLQARLIQCLFANPFRPAALSTAVLSWNDALVVRLAQVAYHEQRLPAGTLYRDRLAILADALEEAGADAALVIHLREPGPHWRGCHALDLLLGKS